MIKSIQNYLKRNHLNYQVTLNELITWECLKLNNQCVQLVMMQTRHRLPKQTVKYYSIPITMTHSFWPGKHALLMLYKTHICTAGRICLSDCLQCYCIPLKHCNIKQTRCTLALATAENKRTNMWSIYLDVQPWILTLCRYAHLRTGGHLLCHPNINMTMFSRVKLCIGGFTHWQPQRLKNRFTHELLCKECTKIYSGIPRLLCVLCTLTDNKSDLKIKQKVRRKLFVQLTQRKHIDWLQPI